MKVPLDWKELESQARAAMQKAYAPYSRFQVGCAVEEKGGRVFTGCNVENASYSLTSCAEKTALVKMVSEGFRQVKRVAIVTSSHLIQPPCGSCRQMMAEFGSPDVFTMNVAGDRFEVLEFDKLLPYRFSGEELAKG